MAISEVLKEKVRQFYLTGDYVNNQHIVEKFPGITIYQLRAWIERENWYAEKQKIMRQVQKSSEVLADDIKRRNDETRQLWLKVKRSIINVFDRMDGTTKAKTLSATDHSAYSAAISKIHAGERLCDGVTEHAEAQVTLIYKGLAERISDDAMIQGLESTKTTKSMKKNKKQSKKGPKQKKKSRKKKSIDR